MATLSQMGIPGSGNGILAPKLKNRWQVRFIGIAKAANGNGQNLTAQAVTVSRPNLSFEEVNLLSLLLLAFSMTFYSFLLDTSLTLCSFRRW